MRYLALLFFVGFAAASFYDELDNVANEAVTEFMAGMDKFPSLKEYLGVEGQAYDDMDDNIKTELGKDLKEKLDEVIAKIKEHLEHGKQIKKEWEDKALEFIKNLKELGFETGNKFLEKLKELKDRFHEKLQDFLQKLKDRFGLSTRAVHEGFDLRKVDFDRIKDIVQNIVKELREHITVDKIKHFIEIILPDDSLIKDVVLDNLDDGIADLREVVDKLLECKLSRRSLADWRQKMMDFLEKLKLEWKEKSEKVREWIENIWALGKENIKGKITLLKEIARKVIDHAKEMKKEVAEQALEFFRPYKEDLGILWDHLKQVVQEIRNKE